MKEKFIFGVEDCETCSAMENWLGNHPKEDVSYFKIQQGEPQSDQMVELLVRNDVDPEGFPFCLELEGKKPTPCSIEPLLDEMNRYFDH